MVRRTVDMTAKAASALFAIILVLTAALLAPLPGAYADMRTTDVVLGQTIEARGLTAAQTPNIDCERALVMDGNGTVYFERNADEPARIASVTKVMTAVTAVGAAPLDTRIVVSWRAASVGESTASLEEDDEMPLSEALKALLWPSGNDAAVAIAECVGALLVEQQGGDASDPDACTAAFVAEMNRKSAEIGLTASVWTNPHGLDEGSYGLDMQSTARDVALLARYAMGIDAIRAITSVHGGACTVDRYGREVTIELESTDELLPEFEGTIGVKTGFTDNAGYCFAGAYDLDGVQLYSAVLGSPTEWQRFDDTRTLWEWVMAHRLFYALVHAQDATAEGEPIVARVACRAWNDRTVPATVADPQAAIEVFDLLGNVTQNAVYAEPEGAVRKGDVLGHIDFYQRNASLASIDIIAAEDVPAPGFFEGLAIAWQRFLAGFSGEDCVAKSYLTNEMPLVNDKTMPQTAQ